MTTKQRESKAYQEFADKVESLSARLKDIKNVPGCIVECGVCRGLSFLAMAHLMKAYSINKDMYGFDSWVGAKFVTEGDLDHRDGMFMRDEAKIRKYVREQMPRNQTYVLKQGFLEDTLPEFSETIALIHIDVDYEKSTQVSLDTLWPLLSDGGIIVLDDYQHPQWPGGSKVINQFVGDHNEAWLQSGTRWYLKKGVSL